MEIVFQNLILLILEEREKKKVTEKLMMEAGVIMMKVTNVKFGMELTCILFISRVYYI